MTTKINLTASDNENSPLFISFTDLNVMNKKKLQDMLFAGREIYLVKSGMLPIKLVPATLG